MAKPRDWHRARKPVQIHEITEAMLAPARSSAEKSWLPQTVWPSWWYGAEFVGIDCLLTNVAHICGTPHDAAEGSHPFLTVLPGRYFDHWIKCEACDRYTVGKQQVNGPYSDGRYYHDACWAGRPVKPHCAVPDRP
jgi:hypothetical protein